MSHATKDPTFVPKGRLDVTVINDTNVSTIDVHHFVTLDYTPRPPRVPWTYDKEYRLGHGDIEPRRAATWLTVKERSGDVVEKGIQYRFEVEIRSRPIRLFCDIRGVEGGSVVSPGFVLFNLKNDGKWTYFWPRAFTGEWGITVINPAASTPMSLYARYNRGQQWLAEPWSRLNFFFDWRTSSGFKTAPEEEQQDGPLEIL